MTLKALYVLHHYIKHYITLKTLCQIITLKTYQMLKYIHSKYTGCNELMTFLEIHCTVCFT